MPTDLTGQQLRLVEPALPPPPPMQRHRHDRVKATLARQHLNQKTPQWSGQWLNAIELEKMDQLAKGTLVGAGGIGFVEPVEP